MKATIANRLFAENAHAMSMPQVNAPLRLDEAAPKEDSMCTPLVMLPSKGPLSLHAPMRLVHQCWLSVQVAGLCDSFETAYHLAPSVYFGSLHSVLICQVLPFLRHSQFEDATNAKEVCIGSTQFSWP